MRCHSWRHRGHEDHTNSSCPRFHPAIASTSISIIGKLNAWLVSVRTFPNRPARFWYRCRRRICLAESLSSGSAGMRSATVRVRGGRAEDSRRRSYWSSSARHRHCGKSNPANGPVPGPSRKARRTAVPVFPQAEQTFSGGHTSPEAACIKSSEGRPGFASQSSPNRSIDRVTRRRS